MTRVVLADDHRMLRSILKGFLESEPEIEVVAEAEDGLQALQAAAEFKPDVVISDLRMEKMDGLELAREIQETLPATRVIILSMHNDPAVISQAMEAGASGYVLKGTDLGDLLRAIEQVSSGQRYLSPALSV
ncbi:MAG: response regulator transcription factor [Acidobacteria bacterium]|nr:response regulator transcription factor [Acidobacteriota bacterium]